ncbi:hypothetical protein GCM10023189_16350 [Nibrella saemangeumensis]|uniref:histidine kinase n=1 Tax=Nibrella saemangeumensis TaxID=1084526 RepID=A0ABP8MN62_9BACT
MSTGIKRAPGRELLSALETVPDLYLILSPDLLILTASDAYLAATFTTRSQITGRHVFDVFPDNPATREAKAVANLRASLQNVLETKKPHRMVRQHYDVPDGSGGFVEKYWLPVNTPVLDEQGDVWYIIHKVEDVTDLARRATDKYLALLNSMDEGFCILQMLFDEEQKPVDYRFIEINPAFEDQTGMKNTLGRTASELVPDLEPFWFDIYGRVALTGESTHFENFAGPMGRWFDVYAFRIGEPDERHVALFFKNITDRKHTEEALRHSEERFRRMVDAVPESMWITDATGNIEFLNQQWYDYCGVSDKQETAADVAVRFLHPEDGPKVMAAFSKAMQTGLPFEVEQRNRSASGEYRWFLNRANPYRDLKTGEIINWFGVGVDIHDRKLAEQALQEADRRKNEFLALLAHELRNPLSTLHNLLLILKMTGGADESLKLETAIDMMNREVQQLVRLVDDLLDVSRISHGKTHLRRQRLDLTELVKLAVEAARPLVERGKRRLSLSLPAEPLYLDGDATRLTQVVRNLLGNAAKFTRNEGQMAISLERDGQNARLRVADNGIGIPPDELDRIFNMFVQVDASRARTQEGLGLGLTLVKELVELHGGRVAAYSAGVDAGSTFTVYLPLLPE